MAQRGCLDSWCGVISTALLAAIIPYYLYKLVKRYNRNYDAKFRNKVVLITGASSGIGEALAYELYKQGCKLVLCARREDQLERVQANLLKLKTEVPTYPPFILPLDVSDVNTLPERVDEIRKSVGEIDILVNNAGISSRGTVDDTDLSVYMQVMNVNYFGTVALTKAVLPEMIKRRKGHIVMMSSVQGIIAIPERSPYAAAKHALQAFSDSLRTEVNEYGIKVTVISPAYIRTDFSMNALTGSGEKHNLMDPATEKGMAPELVARETVIAIADEEKELLLSPWVPRAAIFLRHNIPCVYFFIMVERLKRLNKKTVQEEH